ncbi:MAG: hypothetical protein AB7K68_11040 [Bacteriovoracia bacterium]
MEIKRDNVITLNNAKLSRFLGRAAEFHRNRDYQISLRAIADAGKLLDAQNSEAHKFLISWEEAIERESRGLPLSAPPTSWGKIAREIGACLERNENFDDCILQQTHQPKRILLQRYGFGLLGALLFVIGFTALAFVLRGVFFRFDNGYRLAQLPFFRQGIWLYFHALATAISGGALAALGFRWIRFACHSRASLKPKMELRPLESDQKSF